MSDKHPLSSNMEDYLEAIFHIVNIKQAARAKDIANRLNVNNSSVTGALKTLSEKGYINYAPYDLITLTEKGKQHAQQVVRKHRALKNFFIRVLGADPKEAEDTACKMEHAISSNIMERLVRFVEFVEECPRGGQEWVKAFDEVCEGKEMAQDCEKCISHCLEDARKEKDTEAAASG